MAASNSSQSVVRRGRTKRQRVELPTPKSVPYNEQSEGLPRHPAYHSSFREAVKLIPAICDPIIFKIADLKGRGYQDANIDLVGARLKDLRSPDYRVIKAKRVGFLGAQGVGKSSLINALLGQQVTAETNNGSSGTHVIMEFVKAERSQKQRYKATIFFHSQQKIEELVEKLFNDICDYMTLDEEEKNEEDIEEHATRRTTAMEIFHCLLRDEQNFSSYENTVNFFTEADLESEHAEIKSTIVAHVLTYLSKIRSGSRSNEIVMDSDELSDITKHIRQYCQPAARQPSPWPLVNRVSVHMENPLLAEGVVLVDLPGITDSNHLRVNSTKQYLKTCNTIIIAHPLERIVDHAGVDRSLRECARLGKLKHIFLVATKSDLIRVEDELDWPQEDLDELDRLEEEEHTATQELQELNESGDLAKIHAEANAKKSNLEHAAARVTQKHIIMRNNELAIKLEEKYSKIRKDGDPPLTILCVSNSAYQEHLAGYKLQSPPKLDVASTNIPLLRKLLYSMPAEDRFDALQRLCRQELRTAFNRLILRCGKSFTQRRNDVNALITEPKACCMNAISETLEKLNVKFKEEVTRFIEQHETKWLSRAKTLEVAWRTYAAARYNAICRHSGEWSKKNGHADVTRINWNQELVKIFHDQIDRQLARLEQSVFESRSSLQIQLKSQVDVLKETLKNSPILIGLDMAVFFESLDIHRDAVSSETTATMADLEKCTFDIRSEMTSGDIDGYMRTIMGSAYNACRAAPKGKGVTSRHRAIIFEKMQSKMFSDCGLLARAAFSKALARWETAARETLKHSFAEIEKDFECRFTKAENDEETDQCLRQSLAEAVMKAREQLDGPLTEHLDKCSEYSAAGPREGEKADGEEAHS